MAVFSDAFRAPLLMLERICFCLGLCYLVAVMSFCCSEIFCTYCCLNSYLVASIICNTAIFSVASHLRVHTRSGGTRRAQRPFSRLFFMGTPWSHHIVIKYIELLAIHTFIKFSQVYCFPKSQCTRKKVPISCQRSAAKRCLIDHVFTLTQLRFVCACTTLPL